MRKILIAVVLSVLPSTLLVGQGSIDPDVESLLRRLFPDAASFAPKGGNPPHFKVYGAAVDGAEPRLVGLAYWTTELEPLERGYDGPIKMLVGMDTNGVLAGIIVTEQHEPYGDFSVEPPAFAKQFEHKSIRDPFRVGDDIDAVSRATISVTSATRAVRNSSRRIARALLKPPEQ